jgi:hypothetical protein
VVLGVLVVLVLVAWPLVPPLARSFDQPCPGGQRIARPLVARLAPTVWEHQNWVGVPVHDVALDMVLFACADGLVVGSAIVDTSDLRQAVVTIGVPTRWVLAHWLAGDLEQFQAIDRWSVVFRPAAQAAAQPNLNRGQMPGSRSVHDPSLR